MEKHTQLALFAHRTKLHFKITLGRIFFGGNPLPVKPYLSLSGKSLEKKRASLFPTCLMERTLGTEHHITAAFQKDPRPGRH